MESVIAGLLKDFEDGKMTRRQLIQSLALAAVAAAPARARWRRRRGARRSRRFRRRSNRRAWKTVWLDHISYQVSDYRRSTAFYRDLDGLDDPERQRHQPVHARTSTASAASSFATARAEPQAAAAPRSRRRAAPHRRSRHAAAVAQPAAVDRRHQSHLVGRAAVGYGQGEGGAREARPEPAARHGRRELQELPRLRS